MNPMRLYREREMAVVSTRIAITVAHDTHIPATSDCWSSSFTATACQLNFLSHFALMSLAKTESPSAPAELGTGAGGGPAVVLPGR